MGENVKHTPGPWFVSRKHEVGPRSKEDDQSNGMIVPLADVYGDNRNQDASLIAAAPDLLEALKGLLSDIEEYQRINKLGGENNHWQVISRAAIAKAEARP